MSDGDTVRIEGTTITWADGSVSVLQIRNANTCAMELDGQLFTGSLVGNDRLAWNDGDTWIRASVGERMAPSQPRMLDNHITECARDAGISGRSGSAAPLPECTIARHHRGRRQALRQFSLEAPFGDPRWRLRVNVAGSQHVEACREWLERAARRVGACPDAPGLSDAERQAVQRLGRLEARFQGRGVHEGEAHNALRLFERELARAQWSRDTFERLRRQLDGEELSATDVVIEASVCWTAPTGRRAPWFCDACQRIAAPLCLAFGQSRGQAGWDGCCFVGPLAAAVGAALTAVLVSRLGHLDHERLSQDSMAGCTRRAVRSLPQFLQGFVDGCLEEQRAKVWERLLSLPAPEAKVFVQEQRKLGFFFEPPAQDGCAEEVRGFVSSLFTRALPNGPTAALRDDHGACGGRQLAAVVHQNVALLRRAKRCNARASVADFLWGRRALPVLKRTVSGDSYKVGHIAGSKRRSEVRACGRLAQAGSEESKRRRALPR